MGTKRKAVIRRSTRKRAVIKKTKKKSPKEACQELETTMAQLKILQTTIEGMKKDPRWESIKPTLDMVLTFLGLAIPKLENVYDTFSKGKGLRSLRGQSG